MDKPEINLSESNPVIHPLYVLVTAVLGGTLGWGVFRWNYSPPLTTENVLLNEFWIWLFLIMCFMALLAVFAVPMWAIFINLFRKQVLRDKDKMRKSRTIFFVIVCGFVLAVFVIASNFLIQPVRSEIFNVLPPNHIERVQFVYGCTFIVVLPIALSFLLIFYVAQKIAKQILVFKQNAERLFELAKEIISYRNLLQNLLYAGGLILSMVPVTSAGLISFLTKLAKGSG
jgi:hypothetical protein